jgi:putative ATPase
LLPSIEKGLFYCIGATTENPSFSLNNALLSRMQVYVVNKLNMEEMESILQQAFETAKSKIKIEQSAKEMMIENCNGDARRLINICQIIIQQEEKNITKEWLKNNLSQVLSLSDNKGDIFYELASALHKSIRSSDTNASLYWLARMVSSGIDLLYIARRLVVMASEDIGNADPKALDIAINAYQTHERLGAPESHYAFSQAVVYLSIAPKSNASYKAFKKAMELVKQFPNAPVPMQMRNATTKIMQKQGFGVGYNYDHDFENSIANNQCLPKEIEKILQKDSLYKPTDNGLEKKIKDKLDWIQTQKSKFD